MIALGKEVRCKITGFRGIATSRAEYLYGCIRIGVQAKAKGTTVDDAKYFDEPQLEEVGEGVTAKAKYRHGSRHDPIRGADPAR